MRPIVYITAALLAIVAGYYTVYVSFSTHGNEKVAEKKPVIEKKTEIAEKKASSVNVKQEDTSPETTGETTQNSPNIVAADGLRGLNKGHMTTFVVRQKPQDIPAFEFHDKEGATKTLKDFKGKVVLLNLWATWCAPCRKEMPALDNLKAKLGGDNFDVVTISIDRGGIVKPLKFFKDIGVKKLALYHDRTSRLASKLLAFGMPTTLLIDAKGKELGRLTGPAEWDSEDAITLMKAAMDLK